jgi:hypothetical protein
MYYDEPSTVLWLLYLPLGIKTETLLSPRTPYLYSAHASHNKHYYSDLHLLSLLIVSVLYEVRTVTLYICNLL